jgi:hypothetical protein
LRHCHTFKSDQVCECRKRRHQRLGREGFRFRPKSSFHPHCFPRVPERPLGPNPLCLLLLCWLKHARPNPVVAGLAAGNCGGVRFTSARAPTAGPAEVSGAKWVCLGAKGMTYRLGAGVCGEINGLAFRSPELLSSSQISSREEPTRLFTPDN